MITTTKFSVLAALSVLFVSCGPKDEAKEEAAKYETPKEIADAVLTNMESMMTAATTVTDTASAKAAAEEMEKLSNSMNALAEQLKTMDKPSEETKTEISADMEERVMAAMKNLTEPEIVEAEAAEIEKIMTAAQEKFEESTKDAQQTFEDYFRPESDKDLETEVLTPEPAEVE